MLAAAPHIPLQSPARPLPPWQVPDEVRSHFRRLAAMLDSMCGNGVCVGICSNRRGEGVTWVTAMLACAIAEKGLGVTVVEASSTQSPLMERFGIDAQRKSLPRPAGQFLLHGTASPDVAIAVPRDGIELSPKDLVDGVRCIRPSSAVLVDCGALTSCAAVLQLAPVLEGALFVVEAELERRDVIQAALNSIRWSGTRVLGVVLNKRRQYAPSGIQKNL